MSDAIQYPHATAATRRDPTPPAPPVGKGRLWLAIVLAPAAWALSELVGYMFVSRSCEPWRSDLSNNGLARPGLVLTVVAAVMVLVSIGALLLALGSWRTLQDRRAPSDEATRVESGAQAPEAPTAVDPEWGRARFMAFAGIFASALCGLGILFWTMPSFLLNVCSQVR